MLAADSKKKFSLWVHFFFKLSSARRENYASLVEITHITAKYCQQNISSEFISFVKGARSKYMAELERKKEVKAEDDRLKKKQKLEVDFRLGNEKKLDDVVEEIKRCKSSISGKEFYSSTRRLFIKRGSVVVHVVPPPPPPPPSCARGLMINETILELLK